MTAPTPLPAFFGDPALRAVLAALPRARIVGGAVRDTLAGRAVSDLDLATPDPPDTVIAALDAAGLKHAPTGLQHGTVTAISGGRGFEVTTLRRDERTDGRHAEVAWTDDWTEDAARRDFTINAMSMQPDGTVFDYFDGRADLAAGRVRFVGDPAARIAEDYLRILRFYRFHGRYARIAPDAGTARAIADGTPGLAQLSAERVWSELKRILLLPDPAPTLRLMQQLGTLDAILPGTSSPDAVWRLVQVGAPADPILRLAALQPGASAAGIAERFRLSRAEAAELAALDGPAPDADWDDDALRRALADTVPATLAGRAWLQGGDASLLARIAATPRPVFPLQGRDLLRLGLPPGPGLGEHLAALRGWWQAGGCRADAAACQAELAARLALPPGDKLASAARD